MKKIKICNVLIQIKRKMINLINKNKIKNLNIKNKKVNSKKKDCNIIKITNRKIIMKAKQKKLNQKIFKIIIMNNLKLPDFHIKIIQLNKMNYKNMKC